jgi:hypothetical protein
MAASDSSGRSDLILVLGERRRTAELLGGSCVQSGGFKFPLGTSLVSAHNRDPGQSSKLPRSVNLGQGRVVGSRADSLGGSWHLTITVPTVYSALAEPSRPSEILAVFAAKSQPTASSLQSDPDEGPDPTIFASQTNALLHLQRKLDLASNFRMCSILRYHL